MSLSLAVSDITKQYEEKDILKNCSYSFDEVGIYALIGPNGGGKSTFLRICALSESPDQGLVRYHSGATVVPQDKALKRRITLVLEPEVLFLDEPTASIDPQNTTLIEEIILKLK